MKHNETPIIFSNFHLTKVQFYNGVFRSVFATQDTILSRNNVTEVMFPQICFPLSRRSSTGDEQLMHRLCQLSEDENTSSVQFSCSIVLDLRLHGLQHARLPCPPPTHRPPVQFSYSVVSNSLQPHGLQHARPPCPSPTTRVYSNSRPSSQ